MGGKIFNFREFTEDVLNEGGPGSEINPGDAQLGSFLNQIQQSTDRINKGLNQATSPGGRSGGSSVNQQEVDAPGVTDIGKIKAIDLLLATSAGASLGKFLADNPDYIAQQGISQEAISDSPLTVGSILNKLNRSRKSKEEFETNVETIKKAAEDDSMVLQPDYNLLPSSSPYDYGSLKDKRSYRVGNSEERWDAINKALEDEGYKVDTDEVNIIAVRNKISEKNGHQNHFTDWIMVMNPEDDKEVDVFRATTTPSPLYLAVPFRNWYVAANPNSSINPKGLAILQPGKYSYKVGNHKGYKALVQDGSVTVQRYIPVLDPKDAKFTTYSPGNAESGKFGINIHKAGSSGSERIDSYSAGCLVFQNPDGLRDTLNALSDNNQKKVDVYVLELDDLKSDARNKVESVIASRG
jgi:hypothetical protein